MWICIAHHHEYASNALPLHVHRRWSMLNKPFSQTTAQPVRSWSRPMCYR